jgi:mRNA-degrading endonuclease toxin of MazEF toxin-antitoxin module
LIQVSGTQTRVLTDQLRGLDVQTVKSGFGRLAPQELEALDEALALVLGLRV